jgi:hypothetical protein
LHEYSIRIFERLFIHSKGRSVPLKQRLFSVFERFNGPSVFKKLQFFFSKHILDENDKLDKLSYFASQSQFLDFILYSFRADVPLRKLRHTSLLFPFKNPDVSFENLIPSAPIQGNPIKSEYHRVRTHLAPFTERYTRYRNRRLDSLISALYEVVSLNPNYSQEKLISDKLLIFLFHQLWNKLLTRDQQQYLAEGIKSISCKPCLYRVQLRLGCRTVDLKLDSAY